MERAAVRDAVRLAELWLDDATALPSTSAEADAWSRAEWVEATLPVWRQLCDPVAAARRVGDGRGGAGRDAAARSAARGHAANGAMFGAQVGQAIGELSGEVVGSIGVPPTTTGRPALLPAAVTSFGAGLIPAEEVRSISRCARRLTSACSPMSRGCARTCSPLWRRTPGGSGSTRAASRRRCRSSTPRIPRRCRRR